MTNLLIGVHDIERESYTIETSAPFSDIFPIDNLRGGKRLAAKGGTVNNLSEEPLNITFSLFTEKPAQFLYIPNVRVSEDTYWADILRLQSSPDKTTFTNRLEIYHLDKESVSGSNKRDLFKEFTKTDPFKYWRLSFSSLTLGRKAFLNTPFIGCFFDLQADAVSWSTRQERGQSVLQADSGSYMMGQGLGVQRDIQVTWGGVTEAKAKEFEEKIGSRKDTDSFLLYASVDSFVLDVESIVHCRLNSFTIKKHPNNSWQTIDAEFVEEAKG
jgi:hypothetical protein